MILSGKEIYRQQKKGNISITPFMEQRLGPNSYNLTLGNKILTYTEPVLSCSEPNPTEEIIITNKGFVMHPGRLYIGHTVETTSTDKFVPMLEGRSSIGRLGIFIHATAGFGDIGFSGQWTLELSCVQPVMILPGMEICQIYFHTIKGAYELYKSEKYQNQSGPVASRLYMDYYTRME